MTITKELLDKYRRGDCTVEELGRLQQYFNQNDFSALDEIFQHEWDATRHQEGGQDESVMAATWLQLESAINHVGHKSMVVKKRILWVSGIAAAFLLIIIAGQFFIGSKNGQFQLVEKSNLTKSPMEIQLPDGSIVWLSPGSKLNYKTPFGESQREVILEGEARFEVKPKLEKPFLVYSGVIVTKVLGTVFNVASYVQRPQIEIALLEGKVSVEKNEKGALNQVGLLLPGEIFTFLKEDGSFFKRQFSDSAIYDWQNGIIYFQRAEISDVVRRLEDWYGITINMSEKGKMNETLVHRIDTKKMTIQQVLDGISLVSKYHFEKISDREFIVKPDE